MDLDHGVPSRFQKYVPLGLLKLSTYYKSKGHEVYFQGCKTFPSFNPDIICFSPIFIYKIDNDILYIKSFMAKYPSSKVRIGGISVSIKHEKYKLELGDKVELKIGLDDTIEFLKPDYDIAKVDFCFGFTTRGCVKRCPWCIVPILEGVIRIDDKWKRHLDGKRKIFKAMDNNILAAGEKHFDSVLSEIQKRGMIIDINQSMDCILFARNEAYADIIKKHESVFDVLRFSFDGKHQEKYVKRLIEIIRKKKINKNMTWSMLYGFNDTPDEIYGRMSILLSSGYSVKPMHYRNLENGNLPKNWSIDFAHYIRNLGMTGILTPGDFRSGKYGKTADEFKRILFYAGKNSCGLRKLTGFSIRKKDIGCILKVCLKK